MTYQLFNNSIRLAYAWLCCGLFVFSLVGMGTATSLFAAEEVSKGEAHQQVAVSQSSPSKGNAQLAKVSMTPIAAIARGLYIESRMGGGWVITDAPVVGDNLHNPGISGSQKNGGGVLLDLSLGYDVTERFALEVSGGGLLVSGGRTDQVRDIQLSHYGLSGRYFIPMSERLQLRLALGAFAFTSSTVVDFNAAADNVADNPAEGYGIKTRIGAEYFVNVRHFSFAIDLLIYAPLDPLHIFVALTPALKYTF